MSSTIFLLRKKVCTKSNSPVEFASGFFSSSLEKLPLKNRKTPRRLNFIQPGFEPPLNRSAICIHPFFRSGGLLLNEVKISQPFRIVRTNTDRNLNIFLFSNLYGRTRFGLYFSPCNELMGTLV